MESYSAFYTANQGRVLGYLLQMTGDYQLARDLTQESFTRYLARYGRRVDNGALLFTIARNAALDAFRKRREEKIGADGGVSTVADPEGQLIAKQGCRRMLAAVRQLNPADRELIALVAAETFSYRQIGEMLDISAANVKVRVHRARLRLKAILKDGGP
jgi:RNA polymerase sigma-70 factor (ECF subfamily)